ncbi:MAG: alpha/beta hydrolase [Bacteroidota bacterium]
MKTLLLVVAFLGIGQALKAQTENFETIHLTTEDGIEVTADLYQIKKQDAPMLLLFHQAGNSRGEYRSIAPQLNAMGFHCLAVDQRSGNEVKGVTNETSKEAVKAGKSTQYADALPDLQAALAYTRKNFTGKCMVWGSSYSASLVFYLASLAPEKIDGLLAFSPGEYFKMDGKSIANCAKGVKCPVFVSSAKNEKRNWEDIYQSIRSEKTFYLPSKKGYHGSRALWPESEGNEKAWEAVIDFLSQFQS